MPKRIECAGLQIDEALHSLLVQEIAPGTGIEPDHFWQGLADIWAALGPENERLLAERDLFHDNGCDCRSCCSQLTAEYSQRGAINGSDLDNLVVGRPIVSSNLVSICGSGCCQSGNCRGCSSDSSSLSGYSDTRNG